MNKKTFPPITKKNLYRIALWPHIRKWLLAFVPIALLLALMRVIERMDTTATIASMLVIGIFLMILCLPQLCSQYRPLSSLRRMPDFDQLLSGKKLYWANGAWGYADDEWFIRVSSMHSVVLRKSEINFDVPVRLYSTIWSRPKAKGSISGNFRIHRLIFISKERKTLTACSEADQNIRNWIMLHGGSINGIWET